jgi:hypothetical protein
MTKVWKTGARSLAGVGMNFDGSSSFRCVRFAFVVAGGFAKLVAGRAGRSGEAQAFPIQDGSLTAEVPRRRSILQSTLRSKYSSTNGHNLHRYGSPKKGFYRFHPIALAGRALPLSGSAFPRLGRTSFAWRTKRTPQSTLLTIYR